MDTRGADIDFGRAPIAVGGDTLVVGSSFDVFRGNTGAVFTFSLTDERATLKCNPVRLSAKDGDRLALQLDAGPEQEGRRYVFAGSLSGTSPGFAVRGTLIPLRKEMDPYYPLSRRTGVLDGDGRATFNLDIPAGMDWLNHRTLHHAFFVLDDCGQIVHVSNVALAGIVNRSLP